VKVPLALLLFIAASAAQELRDRFPLAPPQPEVSQPVRPSKFAETVGRRAALLGREDGTFEAWLFPVKILRDFQLSVYFDGAIEPLPLSEMAERISSAPGRVTITHANAAFTIRQTWVAALDRPVVVVLLDIDTTRPLRLRASLIPELKPMWPASFGGQSSYFDEREHALILGEGLRRYAAVVGSPLFSRSSEQVGHQLPGGTVLLEMDVRPEAARRSVIPIVIAGSSAGSQEARRVYREALGQVSALVRESDDYYRAFAARSMTVETPEPVLNDAFHWARFALDKGWICNEGVGCGLVAGFGPSGASERPGFAWYFGGDALMNSWSILDYGDFNRARALLAFLRDHQRADGKMEHELTQSAAMLDWSRYPYGYYHADTTPLYLLSMARYAVRSGDAAFVRESWDSLENAWRYCVSTLDADGLMSNRKAGAAAVETGALSGRVDKDVYLQGAWLAGLEGFATLARISGHESEADEAARQLANARASLAAWPASRGWLPFGRLTDGSTYDALSSWQALALAHGGLAPASAGRAAASFNRPELSTDWGTRLFATDSPHYDPLSYNDGSVWPFLTGFVTEAEFANHRASAGLQHLYGTAWLTGSPGAGFIPENLSGDRAQYLSHAVPHQLFSSSAAIRPLVAGLLGLSGDALSGTLRFAPHLPASWRSTRFDRFAVGESLVSGVVERAPGRLHVSLRISGKPLHVTLAPALPPGSKLRKSSISGARLEATPSDVHVVLDAGAVSNLDVTFDVEEGVELAPDLPHPEPGDRSRAIRLLDTRIADGRIEFDLAGPSGTSAPLRAWRGPGWSTTVDRVQFPAAASEFSTTTVTFRRAGEQDQIK
jgi:hypothetical protein